MFKVTPDNATPFHALPEENAAASVDGEPWCPRLDIVRLDGGGDALPHELFSNRFDEPLASPHFEAFDEAARAYVTEKMIWTGRWRERHKRP